MADIAIKTTVDSSGLKAGLNQAENKVQQFAAKTSMAGTAVKKMEGAMVTAGAVGSKAMAGLQSAMGKIMLTMGAFAGVKSIMDQGDRIQKLSHRFGESAESIQKVGRVASLAGSDTENLVKSLSKAEVNAVKAAQGSKELQEAFSDLGISAGDFMGLSLEDKLATLADAYDQSTNKAAANAAMVQVLGKSAVELIPLFAQGGDAVRDQMGSMAVASTNTVEAMVLANDRMAEAFENIKASAMDSIGWVLDKIDQMSIKLAGAVAWWSNLGDGIAAAAEAKAITESEGLKMLDEQKEDRIERRNKTSKIDIEEIEKETKEQEANKGKGMDQNEVDKAIAASDKEMRSAEEKKQAAIDKAMEASEKEMRQNAKKEKIDKATEELDPTKDKLDKLKSLDSKGVASDQLRRIGGGFAKSDYKGLSKEQVSINKQLDFAQKQYDELKKVVEALKSRTSTDGITE